MGANRGRWARARPVTPDHTHNTTARRQIHLKMVKSAPENGMIASASFKMHLNHVFDDLLDAIVCWIFPGITHAALSAGLYHYLL